MNVRINAEKCGRNKKPHECGAWRYNLYDNIIIIYIYLIKLGDSQ